MSLQGHDRNRNRDARVISARAHRGRLNSRSRCTIEVGLIRCCSSRTDTEQKLVRPAPTAGQESGLLLIMLPTAAQKVTGSTDWHCADLQMDEHLASQVGKDEDLRRHVRPHVCSAQHHRGATATRQPSCIYMYHKLAVVCNGPDAHQTRFKWRAHTRCNTAAALCFSHVQADIDTTAAT